MLPLQRLDGSDILILSPTPTWPLDYGNRKRIFSVCENLKERGAHIHFLHYPSEGEWRNNYPKVAAEIMSKQWYQYYMSPPTRGLHESSIESDHKIDEWWDEGIGTYIRWLFSANVFDAVIVNYTWLSKALEFVPSTALKVLDTHDRFSNRGDLLEAHGIAKEFFHTTQEEEAKGLERADIVWAIKEDEEIFFRDLLEEQSDDKTQVSTLLHVEQQDLDREVFPYEKNDYLTIGIIGARNNINLTNTQAFLRIAIPIFEKYLVPVKVVIAGTICRDLEEFSHPFVELLGRVESVEAFYASLDIAIVPMTFSTGLKIKVGEALAFGVPLISHKHAFEGYPPSHRLHELESIEEIAMEIVELAYEPKELNVLQKASVESQAKLMQEVDDTLDDLVLNIKKYRDTAIVILPENVYKSSSFYHLHLDHIMGALFEHYRILLYYPFDLDEERVAFLDRMNDWTNVFAAKTTNISSEVQFGMSLEDVCDIWDVKLLWNYDKSNSIVDHMPENELVYMEDYAFHLLLDTPSELTPDVCIESLHGYDMDHNHKKLVWSHASFSYNCGLLKNDVWKALPAEECHAVYILFSGTQIQYKFWKTLFEYTLDEQYKVVWVTEFTDTQENLSVESIEVSELVDDATLLMEPARVVFEINLANSHLIASTAWLMHISNRLIIQPGDMRDEKGAIVLYELHDQISLIVKDLDYAKHVSGFFNGYAFNIDSLEEIMVKYRDNRVKKSLELI